MIESITDAASFVVLAACSCMTLFRAQRTRSTTWLTLSFFFVCFLMGNSYWTGYLLVFGETPRYSNISDMSWIASYVFLLMLELEADKHRTVSAPVPAAWIPVAVCAACGVYFIVTHGDPLINIADEGLLAAVGFFAVRGLAARQPDRASSGLTYNRAFHMAALAFVFAEQAVWIASCFLEPGPIETLNAYIVLNVVLMLSTAALLACAWRSDAP